MIPRTRALNGRIGLVIVVLLPFPHHRQITGVTERAQAGIYCAAVEVSVPVHVQYPFSCARSEKARPRCASAAPVADYGKSPFVAKRLEEAILNSAPIPS